MPTFGPLEQYTLFLFAAGAFLYLSACAGVATIAHEKGRDPFGAFFGSLFFSPIVALLYLIAAGENKERVAARLIRQGKCKRCPLCCQCIDAGAMRCPCCQSDLPAAAPGTLAGRS